jgi:uncharacterized lipoprotein YajG
MKILILLAAIVTLAACSACTSAPQSAPPTPQQISADDAVAHQLFTNGVSDFKTVKKLTK